MKSCFFLGHRDAPDSIRDTLDEAIERHITEYGVTEFFVGHYGHFDRMAQSALVRAKSRHPEINICMVIPYHPAERPIPAPEGLTGPTTRLAWSAFPGPWLSCGQTGI